MDVIESDVKSLSELFFIHDSFAALRVKLLSVESLDGHFSKMLFYTEIGKLVIGNLSVVISVISENILHDVKDFIFVFFE